ncbi:AAA family ATPase [Candidatus Micrarchaeota archaeon]|nr:AAA family ATPase [Candidatus Micrarchaeota archaeon]
MIVGFTGLARSGKDAVAKYVIEKYKFEHLDFARDALFAEADKRGVERDKMSLSILGDELRAESGRGVLAKIIVSKMKENVNYVITGFRSPEEVDYLRNAIDDDFYLVEVYADKLTRFERRKSEDPQNINDFFARDARDIHNKGLGDVLKMADERIENEGTLEQLFAKADALMKKVMQ